MVRFEVKGIQETLDLLTKAPKNIVMLGYARAARAAMNVVGAELAKRTPIQKGNAKTRGDLISSLKIDVNVDPDSKGVTASVGFPGKQATIANALEWGHEQYSHEPLHEPIGAIPAYPFMRPAFDASAEAAVDAFAESLAATLKEEY